MVSCVLQTIIKPEGYPIRSNTRSVLFRLGKTVNHQSALSNLEAIFARTQILRSAASHKNRISIELKTRLSDPNTHWMGKSGSASSVTWSGFTFCSSLTGFAANFKAEASKIINDNLRLVYYCSLNDVNIANSVRNLQRMTANSRREFAHPA